MQLHNLGTTLPKWNQGKKTDRLPASFYLFTFYACLEKTMCMLGGPKFEPN